jgi:hypothetical protein
MLTLKAYNKIKTSIENDPLSTKSPKNRYLYKFINRIYYKIN